MLPLPRVHPITAPEIAPVRADRGVRLLARQRDQHTLSWHDEGTPDREQVEHYIHDRFARAYEAQVGHFMPVLLALRHHHTVVGALGLRPAAEGPLFLEQYLDQPVEQSLAAALRQPVPRDGIIEIGNLAADHHGASLMLFFTLGSLMRAAGYRWLVFSATPQVAAMMTKLNLATRHLAPADPARLGHEAAEWGRYYQTCPQVLVGDMDSAFACEPEDSRELTGLRLFADVGASLVTPLTLRRQRSEQRQ
jgi:hypothetical protein